MSVPSISNVQQSHKIDSTAISIRGYSEHITSSQVLPDTYDTYGRDGLCRNSLFSLYPGRADCIFQGLITNETNMRPAYWRYIGDCDGGDLGYVGAKDQMILGYGAGPRGGVIDPRLDAIQQLNPSSFKSQLARDALEQDQLHHRAKKYNYSVTTDSLARS